jgi:hypothetical protein
MATVTVIPTVTVIHTVIHRNSFETIRSILSAMGLRLTVEPAEPEAETA